MSAKKNAEALIRAGETSAPPETDFWWQQSADAWGPPFFAEMDACCDGLAGTPDWHAAREQLWALRELDEEPGEEITDLTQK